MVNQGTPIYIGRTIIGRVKGDTFHKRIHKGFYTRNQSAIILDAQAVASAQAAGATKVTVRDMDSGVSLSVPIVVALKKGVAMGNGKQIAVSVKEWKEVSE